MLGDSFASIQAYIKADVNPVSARGKKSVAKGKEVAQTDNEWILGTKSAKIAPKAT